jgi:hypothetical protein
MMPTGMLRLNFVYRAVRAVRGRPTPGLIDKETCFLSCAIFPLACFTPLPGCLHGVCQAADVGEWPDFLASFSSR